MKSLPVGATRSRTLKAKKVAIDAAMAHTDATPTATSTRLYTSLSASATLHPAVIPFHASAAWLTTFCGHASIAVRGLFRGIQRPGNASTIEHIARRH